MCNLVRHKTPTPLLLRKVTYAFIFSCEFNREVSRKVETGTTFVREVVGVFTRTDKTLTTITEFFWDFSCEYELFAYQGNSPSDKIVLISRKGACELITSTYKKIYEGKIT